MLATRVVNSVECLVLTTASRTVLTSQVERTRNVSLGMQRIAEQPHKTGTTRYDKAQTIERILYFYPSLQG